MLTVQYKDYSTGNTRFFQVNSIYEIPENKGTEVYLIINIEELYQ